MALLEFDSLEAIPEALREGFVEIGDKWRPAGFVPKTVHEEMLSKAEAKAAGLKELDELKKKLNGTDLDELFAAKKQLAEMERKAKAGTLGKTEEELTKYLAEQTEPMKREHEAAVKALQTRAENAEKQAQELSSHLQAAVLDAQMDTAAAKLAAKGFKATQPAVLRDLRRLAREEGWTVEDGKPVQKRKDGTVVRGADAMNPITPEEWILGTKEHSGIWWQSPGSGGGTEGGSPGNANSKTMSRQAFEKLDELAKRKFLGEGWKLTDAA